MENQTVTPETPRQSQRAAAQQGCSGSVGAVLVGVVIVALTILVQIAAWIIEQAVFDGSQPVADVRWQIALAYALVLILLLAIMTAVTRARARAVFRTWLLAAFFALLMVPARFFWLTDAQKIDLAQIIAMLVFLAGLAIWLAIRAGRGLSIAPVSLRGVWVALFFGLLMSIPWVLWGALGSPLDVFLNVLSGLLFGACASLLLNGSLLAGDTSPRVGSNGTVFMIALAVMCTGFGLNGEQWMLLLALLGLSWGAVAISIYGRGETAGSNWPVAALLLGLAAAWPLTLVDPDELSIVISSGAGELIGWVVLMSFSALALGVITSVAMQLFRPPLAEPRRARQMGIGLSLAALVLAAVLYVVIGQPGFYGERLFVILKDQADVSAAASIPNYNQRRTEVYQTLVKKADTSQANLRAQLDRYGIEYKPYYLVNSLEVWGGPLVSMWLQAQPEVDRVLANPELRPLPEAVPVSTGSESLPALPLWNQTLIGANQVWNELKVNGKGVIVGQSDSGVQGDHPELAAGYRGQGGQNDYNWFDPWNHSRAPVDIGGHGTHTLGSILGKNVGVAPGAQWIGCVNLARNLGNPSLYLDCMQFMLAPFPQNGDPLRDGDPTRGAMVLNNSWGCPKVEGCDANTFLPAVRALRAAGIFTVVSAGNSGANGCGSLTDPPALYADVYAVGAVDSQGQRADFSSVGPVEVDGSNRIKPDIAAPGVNVLSSFPGNTYAVESGTSMAGPHVVGVVALMWSANPKLIGDINRTVQILDQTARPYRGPLPACANGQGSPNDAVGYGIVDAYAAVKMAQESR